MYLPQRFHKNHRLASLKWKKSTPYVSDAVVDKFSHALQTCLLTDRRAPEWIEGVEESKTLPSLYPQKQRNKK